MAVYAKIIKMPDISDLAGEKVIIDFETEHYYVLQGIANDIWDVLNKQQNVNVDDLIDGLLQEYEVDKTVCESQVMIFLKQLEELDYVKLDTK